MKCGRPGSGQEEVLEICKGIHYFSDGMSKDYKSSLANDAIAVLTLGLYVGLPYVLLALIVASFFSTTALYTAIMVAATALLPRGPLRWRAVLASPLIATWRRYFKTRYARLVGDGVSMGLSGC